MKRRALATAAPPDLFAARPITVTPAPEAARVPASSRAVYAPIVPGGTVQREPLHQRWHDVADECPEHRTAAEHCFASAGGQGWAHVVEGGTPRPVVRCVAAVVKGPRALPVGGLGVDRISDTQLRAELCGRY